MRYPARQSATYLKMSAKLVSLVLVAVVLTPIGAASAVSDGGSISGTVRDVTGTALAGVSVSVDDNVVVSGDDGGYLIAGLAPDSYIVAADTGTDEFVPGFHEDAFDEPDAKPVLVGESEQVTGIDVVLHRRGVIRGTVTDIDGSPVAGAMLQLDGAGAAVQSDLDGMYTIIVPEPAMYTVLATSDPEYLPEWLGGSRSEIDAIVIAVDLDSSVERVDFVLDRVADDELPELSINFQPARALVPDGWLADSGDSYDEVRGYGWRTSDGEPATRRQCGDRNATANQVLDTFCHAQTRYVFNDGSWSAVDSPAIWEIALPNGSYDVTVTMGESRFTSPLIMNTIDVEGVRAVADFVATRSRPQLAGTATVVVTDGFLTLDPNAGTKGKIAAVHIAPAAMEPDEPTGPVGSEPPEGEISISASFQPSRVPVPSGWVVDSGAPFSDELGYGWRLPDGGVPQARQCGDRNSIADQALDTFCHAQTRYERIGGSWVPVDSPAVWEIAVPNGAYLVTVTMGESKFASLSVSNSVDVEGMSAIENFIATSAKLHASATVSVDVSDGFLTVDPTAGTRGKIVSVEIVRTDTGPEA